MNRRTFINKTAITAGAVALASTPIIAKLFRKRETQFQLIFPAGVNHIKADFNDHGIDVFVWVESSCVQKLNASLAKDSWISCTPEQKGMAAKPVKFHWQEGFGVVLEMEMIYDQAKNYPEHKYLAGCFRTDCDYKLMNREGYFLKHKSPERGCAENPCRITAADSYCTAYFCDCPAFLKLKEARTATTSNPSADNIMKTNPEIGQLVKLNSGSPDMTITSVNETGTVIGVTWFVGSEKHSDAFFSDCLTESEKN